MKCALLNNNYISNINDYNDFTVNYVFIIQSMLALCGKMYRLVAP